MSWLLLTDWRLRDPRRGVSPRPVRHARSAGRWTGTTSGCSLHHARHIPTIADIVSIYGADMGPTWIGLADGLRGRAMRAKITKRVTDAAHPQQATYLIRDTEIKGFVLVVTRAGAKSYAVDYRPGRVGVRRSGGSRSAS